MSEKKTMLTYEGLKKLEAEMQTLKTERRKEVAEKIKDARGQGDLSENAEYDAAKEEQAEIEARVAVLEKMLRNAELIDEEELSEGYVSVGNKVTVLDREFNEQVEYLLVGSAEADPIGGKISNESPLGEALLGHVAGDVVSVDTPDGIVEYEIIAIG